MKYFDKWVLTHREPPTSNVMWVRPTDKDGDKGAEIKTFIDNEWVTVSGEGYAPPPGGIPKSDLSEEVQTSLNKADTAYQKDNSGIPVEDLNESIQASLQRADTAVQDISGKQDVLVSGESIRTINNESVLGSGNIAITAETYVIDNTPTKNSNNLVTSGGVYGFLPSVPIGDYATAKQMMNDYPFKNFQYLLVSADFVKPVWHYRGKLLDAVGANVNLDTPDLFVFKIKLLEDNDSITLLTTSGTQDIFFPDVNCDYTIDWGDGSEVEHIVKANVTHQYSGEADDIFTITITGRLTILQITSTNGLISRIVSIDMNTLSCETHFNASAWGVNFTKIGSNLETISADAFQNIRDREKISMQFERCTKLTHLPEYIFDGWHLTSAGNEFYTCAALRKIPSSYKYAIKQCTSFSNTFVGACKGLDENNFDYTMFDEVEDGVVTSFQSTFDGFGNSSAVDKIDAYVLYQKMLPKCATGCTTTRCFYSGVFKNRDLVPVSWGGTLSE